MKNICVAAEFMQVILHVFSVFPFCIASWQLSQNHISSFLSQKTTASLFNYLCRNPCGEI